MAALGLSWEPILFIWEEAGDYLSPGNGDINLKYMVAFGLG